MAQRLIRDWTQSDKMNDLSLEAEVFFTRLIMKVDDFGIYYGNIKLLKGALFPLRDAFTCELIHECILECLKTSPEPLIQVYEVGNKTYIKILDFGQRLRAKRSKFPEPLTNDSECPLEVEVEPEVEVESFNINEKIEEIKNSGSWIESVSMQKKITKDRCEELLADFLEEQKIKDEISHRDIKEIKKHFINWLKLEINKKTNVKGKQRSSDAISKF